MKRISTLAAAVAALLMMLCSCDGKQNSEPVTLMVQVGMNESFFDTLIQGAKKDLGIDLRLVYRYSLNCSSLMLQDFIHDNLKGDLVFTTIKMPDEYLEDVCLDFVDRSNLLSNYSYERSREFISGDACAFQLPLSSRLIGITYNATLFEKLGWNLPRTFQDMLDIKRKCDESGRPFAVCEMKFTGRPFNYMFNLMGSQWISTVKGESWLDGFMEGEKTIYPLKKQAEYFRKWTENGLWGDLIDGSVSPSMVFHQKQAPFLFTPKNNFSGYGGDVYKTMPWISEDGSNNCFTLHYNFWVAANGHLADKGREKHLQDVIKVLDYMMSDSDVRMSLIDSADAYSVFDDVVLGDNSLYSDFIPDIRRGFLQPWYYNLFGDPTIIETGGEIGSYIVNEYRKRGWNLSDCSHVMYDINPDATFDSAMGMLHVALHSMRDDYLGWAEEYIGPSKLAELAAIAGGIALQERIEASGADARVSVALMPYVNDLSGLQPWTVAPVQAAEVFQGSISNAYRTMLIPAEFANGVFMTGAQIKEIVDGKYDPSGYYANFDSGRYGPYDYVCVTRNGIALEDDKEYLVAVPQSGLSKNRHDSMSAKGKILMDGDEEMAADLGHGIERYFDKHESISNSNIVWDWE